jgi:hypothetical protein
MSEPGQDSACEEIVADIEATREQLGDTVEELAHRLDVKAQVQSTVEEAKANAQAKLTQTWQQVRTRAAAAAGNREVQVAAGASAVAGVTGLVLLRRR